METTPIGPLHALDALSAAWDQALAGAEAPVGADEAAVPGSGVDLGGKTAAAQTMTRPAVSVVDIAHAEDAARPAANDGSTEFSLPSDQLTPTTLVGLQVESAWTWPLPMPHPTVQQRPTVEEEAPPPAAQHDTAEEEPACDEDPHEPPAEHADITVLDADTDDRIDALARALHAALEAPQPPMALRIAAEQWQRGRCVVLACPQSAQAAEPAWAFVLWPRRARRDALPALTGRRVAARLQWRDLPLGARWCHARLVKEHHPRHGRQLVAVDGAGCTVQLGPVIAPTRPGEPRLCEVRLRIDAVHTFWSALGGQWSVHAIVCSLPLARTEGTPC